MDRECFCPCGGCHLIELLVSEGGQTGEGMCATFRTLSVLRLSLKPGDIVIMDNLSSHKNEATLDLIRQCGARWEFLPAYSPDLNAIEPKRGEDSQPQAALRASAARQKMWSKVKNLLRAAEAHTPEGLEDASAAALDKVTAKGALHWFSSCNYNVIKNILNGVGNCKLASLCEGRPLCGFLNCKLFIINNAMLSEIFIGGV